MFIGEKQKITESKCLKCGKLLDGCSAVENEAKPKKGDFSICIKCGNIAVFDNDLKLRKPTKKEHEEISANETIMAQQRLIVQFAEYYSTLN